MVNATLINITNSIVNATNASLNAIPEPKSGLFASLMHPELLLFIFGILTAASVLIFVIMNVMPVSKFIYANARIQARSSYMITKNILSELIEAKSLKEFRSLLRETIYGEELEKSDDRLRSFHSAIELSFINASQELVDMCPKNLKKLFGSYFMFFEAKILKIIYRTKLMKATIGKNMVYAIGQIDNSLLKHLMSTETVADMGVVMRPTPYAKIFENKYSNLEEFEARIDEFVLNKFIESIKKIKIHDGKAIVNVLNKKIDILNILALLKFRIRKIEKEKQKDLLVKNNTKLSSKFDKLIDAETLKSFVEGAKGTIYYDVLAKAFEEYEKDKSLVHFENELYRFYKNSIIKDELKYTLGPYPLFSYLIKMELEQRNLFIISTGIDKGITAEQIKRMII